MQRPTLFRTWILTALVVIVAASIVAACRPVRTPPGQGAPAKAAATAPEVAGVPPTPKPAKDWERVTSSGRLVVGTAADYAPFEYYNETYQIDGFDPALMRAIGEKLGLDVTFKDIAFEGLGAALDVGQIDVAAAAITVTPERAAHMDFSAPYFASQEGYLVRPDADVKALTSTEDLKGVHIGVERGTTYESWLRQQLVEPGIISAQDLVVYTTIDSAVADLTQGRVDVVVTDLPAAQTLAKKNNLKVATKGLFGQQYAFAVRSGSDQLRSQLDSALAALQQDGTLAKLAKQYLDREPDQLSTPQATNTSGTASKLPPAPCLDSMAFVQDLSLPDQAMTAPAVMAPGQSFSKAWRIQNTGTCAWDAKYGISFAYGNAPGASMSGQSVVITQTIPPGATYDVAANLVAPISPGVYQGIWQMRNARENAFGESLRVGIQVAGAPTPTPVATQTPSPGITFNANAQNVKQGQPVSFSWAVQDAKAVYFYIAGQDWQDKAVEAKGTATDIPASTTTYNLRVNRSNGQEETREITVYVEPAPSLPQVNYFALAPAGDITLGQCINLSWLIGGEVDQVTIFRNKETVWDNAPIEGTYDDCPKAAGDYEYAVGARGPGGVNYAVDSVQVVAGSAAPAPVGPAIDVFSVLPAVVDVNGCVEAKWTVGGDVTSIRVLRDDVVLLDNAPKTGSGADCLTEPGRHIYRLAAANDQGQTAEAQVQVGVGAPAPTAVPVPPTPAPPAAQAPSAGNVAQLVGQELILISYRDASGSLTPPLTGTKITARFEEDGRLSGFAGCNDYSSSYQVGDNLAVSVAPIATTMKFCAEPIGVMDQEAHYLSSVKTAASFAAEAGQLTLMDGAGNPVALFVASH